MDIPADILTVAFRLSPEKAQAYLEKKGYTFSWSWRDTWEDAHARAFTVAKAVRRDVLESIRQVTERAVRGEITFDRFQKTLEPYLKLAGWWGRTWPADEQGRLLDENGDPWPTGDDGTPLIPADAKPPLLGSPHRLRTIYQQNLQTALNVGRYEGQMDVAEKRPYWKYASVVDDRTTGLCLSINGKVYHYRDPFWSVFYPPNHWRCRARVSSLSAREVARDGVEISKTDGQLHITRTKDGETNAAIKVDGHTYKTAEGFAYNPGQAAMQPFTPRAMTGSEYTRMKLTGAVPRSITPADELPAKPDKGMLLTGRSVKNWGDGDYVNAFLGAFDVQPGEPRVVDNVLGDPLVITDELFVDRRTGRYSLSDELRPHMRMMADTLKDPAEIWMTWGEVEGKTRLVEQYIGVYGKGKKRTMVTVEFAAGRWHLSTARGTEIEAAGERRSGKLMYYRKK